MGTTSVWVLASQMLLGQAEEAAKSDPSEYSSAFAPGQAAGQVAVQPEEAFSPPPLLIAPSSMPAAEAPPQLERSPEVPPAAATADADAPASAAPTAEATPAADAEPAAATAAAPAAPTAASSAPLLSSAGPVSASSNTVSRSVTMPSADVYPKFGAMLDAGVPDGAGLSLTFRPVTWLRLHAGATHNVVSGGVRGGVTLIPFRFWVTPTLSAEAGHYFPGDANKLLEMAVGPGVSSPMLQNFSYDYANAHVGLELGSPKRFIFFLRGGLSYLQTSVGNVAEQIDDPGFSVSDPAVRLTLPSLKAGFILYLG